MTRKNQNLSVKIISGSNDLEKAKTLLKETYCWIGITEKFDESLKMLKIIIDYPLDLQYRRMINASSNEIKKKLLSEKSSLDLLKEHNSLDQLLYDFAVKEIFLPQLEKHKNEMETIVLPEQKSSKRVM